MAHILDGEGHEVMTASTLRDALKHIDAPIDLLISDIALSDGSGLELVRRLGAVRKVFAIALSGYGAIGDIERSLEAGFSSHMTKPVDVEQLIAEIERVAGTASALKKPDRDAATAEGRSA